MMSTIMSGVYFFIGKAIAEVLIFFGFLALFVLAFVFFSFVESWQQSKKKKKRK